MMAAYLETSVTALFILFTLAGMFVGSLFSLGISYMTDLLPGNLLPAGNLMIGIAFSLGSISGPFLGGLYVEFFPTLSFFYMIGIMLVFILAAIYFKREKQISVS